MQSSKLCWGSPSPGSRAGTLRLRTAMNPSSGYTRRSLVEAQMSTSEASPAQVHRQDTTRSRYTRNELTGHSILGMPVSRRLATRTWSNMSANLASTVTRIRIPANLQRQAERERCGSGREKKKGSRLKTRLKTRASSHGDPSPLGCKDGASSAQALRRAAESALSDGDSSVGT